MFYAYATTADNSTPGCTSISTHLLGFDSRAARQQYAETHVGVAIVDASVVPPEHRASIRNSPRLKARGYHYLLHIASSTHFNLEILTKCSPPPPRSNTPKPKVAAPVNAAHPQVPAPTATAPFVTSGCAPAKTSCAASLRSPESTT